MSVLGTMRAFPSLPEYGRARRLLERLSGRVTRPQLLLGVLLLAGVSRLWNLNAVGFNSDEAVYAGQAASIAGQEAYLPYFPIFRAHPLLFQTMLSLAYHFGVSDVWGRVLAGAFGVATVGVVYLLGKLLYGWRTGIVAALLLAIMPYHVLVTRQVLLDGPMVFFATLSLYLLARYCCRLGDRWIVAAAAALGLAVVTKETAIILAGGVLCFFLLSTSVVLRARTGLAATAVLLAVAVTFPAAIRLAGATRTGGNYLAWQLFRRANHPLTFYFSAVPPALGLLALAAVVFGLVVGRRLLTWREGLLLSWAAVPLVFFTLMPIKGFQYLLPLAPVVAVLAGRALTSAAVWARVVRRAPQWRAPLQAAVLVLVMASLIVPTWGRVHPSRSDIFLAGSGGLPGGREVGRWIDQELPEGSTILTLGPSMANVVAFYGHRQAYALSVSPNPLNRNPSYTPVDNPDWQLRKGNIQYVVWDAYSAGRSPNFSAKLMDYVRKYRGVAVHSYAIPGADEDSVGQRPVIVLYQLRP